MTKLELQGLLKSLRMQTEKGKNRFDSVLSNIFLNSEADVQKAIQIVIEEFVNKRNREPSPEEIAAAYVIFEERKQKITDQEFDKVFKEKETMEVENDRIQDQEQNRDLLDMNEQRKDDLFLLTQNNGNFKLQDKEAIMKDKTDRQRNVFERNLKLLEALEKIREVSEKTDGMLQVDLNSMMDLLPNEFELQKKMLSRFKLQPLSAKGFEIDRENPERQINLETITKEDLENGDIVFAISFENLQKMEDVYKNFKEQMKEHLKVKGIKVEDKEPLSIEEDVINALAGVNRNAERNTTNNGKNKEDDYEMEM